MEPSPEGIEKCDYYMPWSDLLEKLILTEMRYVYYKQFAAAIKLDRRTLSKIVNGHGRLGAPSKPKTLLKMVQGFILGEFPEHPPVIRSSKQLTAFLDAVARKFWRGEYGGRVFRDTGRLWLEQSVEDAFARQRELWSADEEKQETIQEPTASPAVTVYHITQEEINQLVQAHKLINSVICEILDRSQPRDEADN